MLGSFKAKLPKMRLHFILNLTDGPAPSTESSRQSTFATHLQQHEPQPQEELQAADANPTGLVTATPVMAVMSEPAEEPFSSMVTQLGGAKGRQLLPLQAATRVEGEMNVQATSPLRDQVGTRESNSSSGKKEDKTCLILLISWLIMSVNSGFSAPEDVDYLKWVSETKNISSKKEDSGAKKGQKSYPPPPCSGSSQSQESGVENPGYLR